MSAADTLPRPPFRAVCRLPRPPPGALPAVFRLGLPLRGFQQWFPEPLMPLPTIHRPQGPTQPRHPAHSATCSAFCPEQQLVPGLQGCGHHGAEWEREQGRVFAQRHPDLLVQALAALHQHVHHVQHV